MSFRRVSAFFGVPFLFLFCTFSFGQTVAPDASFRIANREKLRAVIPDSTMVVLFSAPVHFRAGDVDFKYHQDPDFLYFTGFSEAQSILCIAKEKEGVGKDILWIRKKNPDKEMWNGIMASREEAGKVSGVEQIEFLEEFSISRIPKYVKRIITLLDSPNRFLAGENAEIEKAAKEIFINFPGPDRDLNQIQSIGYDFAKLRQKKDSVEIVCMEKAIRSTGLALCEAMKAIEPGMGEGRLQGIIEFVFRADGCPELGFPSIVGSGPNSCILHYTENSRIMRSGDMVVMDVGAEFAGYSADITRTVPVNGTFSPVQKSIYEIVLAAQEAGIRACKPGAGFSDPGRAAQKVVAEGLIKLGIIKNEKQARKYFPHGTSHYLGLDVHDAGTYQELREGQVITVEPGIYIPAGSDCNPKWWNIGVRIEDDVLITIEGNRVLSDLAPKEPSEIEALMVKKGNFLFDFGK